MAIPVLALALSTGLTAAPPPTRFIPDNPPALTAPLLRPVEYGYCNWRCQDWRHERWEAHRRWEHRRLARHERWERSHYYYR